jgi:hypothetical protein
MAASALLFVTAKTAFCDTSYYYTSTARVRNHNGVVVALHSRKQLIGEQRRESRC